jgi:hypothetical protein
MAAIPSAVVVDRTDSHPIPIAVVTAASDSTARKARGASRNAITPAIVSSTPDSRR